MHTGRITQSLNSLMFHQAFLFLFFRAMQLTNVIQVLTSSNINWTRLNDIPAHLATVIGVSNSFFTPVLEYSTRVVFWNEVSFAMDLLCDW